MNLQTLHDWKAISTDGPANSVGKLRRNHPLELLAGGRPLPLSNGRLWLGIDHSALSVPAALRGRRWTRRTMRAYLIAGRANIETGVGEGSIRVHSEWWVQRRLYLQMHPREVLPARPLMAANAGAGFHGAKGAIHLGQSACRTRWRTGCHRAALALLCPGVWKNLTQKRPGRSFANLAFQTRRLRVKRLVFPRGRRISSVLFAKLRYNK